MLLLFVVFVHFQFLHAFDLIRIYENEPFPLPLSVVLPGDEKFKLVSPEMPNKLLNGMLNSSFNIEIIYIEQIFEIKEIEPNFFENCRIFYEIYL